MTPNSRQIAAVRRGLALPAKINGSSSSGRWRRREKARGRPRTLIPAGCLTHDGLSCAATALGQDTTGVHTDARATPLRSDVEREAQVDVGGGATAADAPALQPGLEDYYEAFRIPDDDRTQRIVEHEPENFEIPPGSSNRYMLIEITAFPGRSAEAKRNLYRALVQRLGEIAIDPMDVSAS